MTITIESVTIESTQHGPRTVRAERRQCGGCNLCCKLLPMHDNEPWRGTRIDKAAGQPCPHQRHRKGCAIYAKRPFCCQVWNCRWLVDDAGTTSRPDRVHYVIDVMPDIVRAQDNSTGQVVDLPVIQIWVDPDYPDAHRDPALRAWLEAAFEKDGSIALVRYNEKAGFTLMPPALTGQGWVEMRDRTKSMQRDGMFSHPDTWRER